MNIIRGIELKQGSREELLPGFSPEFPYIASCVELDQYIGGESPWHWHREVELFYMEKGALEYTTPQGTICFSAGSGGFINSNVLHMTRAKEGVRPVTALVHLFDPVLISGQKGSVIDRKYVLPLLTAPQISIVGLYHDNPEHGAVLKALRESFQIPESDAFYEIRLRSAVSDLWRYLLELSGPLDSAEGTGDRVSEKIKTMLIYIHEHCAEKISVAKIAGAAFISERECYRVFHDSLHTTPVEYMTGYRIQMACHMLAEGEETITSICHACGLSTSSYFGRVFRERIGCSPMEFRAKWRDNAIKGQ